MHSASATIYCPYCQAPNLESHQFCQKCSSSLLRRYLWAAGNEAESLRSGNLLAGRYLVKQGRLLLDTQPGILPESPEDLPTKVESYLRLVPYRPHVPQVYTLATLPNKRGGEVLLLEHAPIYPQKIGSSDSGEYLEGTLMPGLADVWKQSTPLRQLNWLWQIAQLWQPLSREYVVSTLLNPALLKVEGSLVRLLELQSDGRMVPTLVDLGRLWRQWQTTAHPAIADFLGELSQQMVREQISHAEQLMFALDRALATCGQDQPRQVQLATLTDQGPTRQRNEDACYPPSGSFLTVAISGASAQGASGTFDLPWITVCDGIGGHDGGNVASNLAIATVQQHLQPLLQQPAALTSEGLTVQLEQAALAANDAISQRNDTERRQERQRMGTTLVMALARSHELYLAHVGDSRAYRITKTGCHQVTLDDDLAAREVRLGYALYRDALQQPGSGALIQALGMNASTNLHPTVQRFILDEDCLFLLCSDGLSDRDRVEQYWQTELLPVLEGKVNLATVSQRLVALANLQNGHDNVTVGLVYCQVGDRSPISPPLDAALAILPGSSQVPGGSAQTIAHSTKTQLLPRQRRSFNPLTVVLGVLLGMGSLGAIAYLLAPSQIETWIATFTGTPDTSQSVSPPASRNTSPPMPSPTEATRKPAFKPETLLQIKAQDTNGKKELLQITPLQAEGQPQATAIPPINVPVGSILKVEGFSESAKGFQYRVKVCWAPSRKPATPLTAKAGMEGQVDEHEIIPLVTSELNPTTEQRSAINRYCTPAVAPTTQQNSAPSNIPPTSVQTR